MHDSFEVFEYIRFLRARWRFTAFACAIAMVGAVAACVLLPRRYTSTATILIDPAGGEPPMATAVSTVYLESLKTYEFLATNDQLFARAIERFHLRDRDRSPVESLKRRVLKVAKLRDTRALQISVTLSDPRTAQAMAQFIAEGAVALNRSGSKESGDALIREAEKAASDARVRLRRTEEAWEKAATTNSEDALRTEVSDESELKSRAEEQLLDEQADAAQSEQGSGASHARIEVLQRRIGELSRTISQKSAALARQSAENENLEALLNAARTEYQTDAQRLADLPLTLGTRSEFLRVVDPGIVPERPSSPNVALILIGSFALALFGSLLYLTVAFAVARGERTFPSRFQMASHGDD